MAALPTVQMFDPRVNISASKQYSVLRTGTDITYKEFPTNTVSNTNINFNCPPPSLNTIIDRQIFLKLGVNLKFTGTAPVGQRLLQNHNDSFRAFPISGVMSNLQVTINNNSMNINLQEMLSCLTRYHNPQHVRDRNFSIFPSCLDKSQNYSDMVGLNTNPLASYGENSYESPRGAFPISVLSNNVSSGGPTTAEINADLVEPLIISPLLVGDDTGPGFVNINQFTVNIVFDSNLGYMWSHSSAGGSVLGSVVVTITRASLLFTYITPNPLTPIPASSVFGYYPIVPYITGGSSLAPLATAEVTSNTITLLSVPKKIYVYARRRNADKTFNTTDTFLSIENISVTYKNKVGILSGATKQHLYNVAIKNGCSMSWEEWSGEGVIDLSSGNQFGTVGSVLCLTMSDIGMDELTSVGLVDQNQLQVKCTFKNQNRTDSINYDFYILTVSEGVFSVYNGHSSTQVGVLNQQDVLMSRNSPVVDYKLIENIYGGSFLEGLKSVWDGIKTGVSEVSSLVAPLMPLVKPAMGMMGLGAPVGGDLGIDGGRRRRRRARKGGRMISRSELARNF